MTVSILLIEKSIRIFIIRCNGNGDKDDSGIDMPLAYRRGYPDYASKQDGSNKKIASGGTLPDCMKDRHGCRALLTVGNSS
jgi:hypothetical protein